MGDRPLVPGQNGTQYSFKWEWYTETTVPGNYKIWAFCLKKTKQEEIMMNNPQPLFEHILWNTRFFAC